jgi:hypothetical protein
MPRQPVPVELGDQPMLVRRIKQPRWVQPVHQLAQPVETRHIGQRIRAMPAAVPLTRPTDRFLHPRHLA